MIAFYENLWRHLARIVIATPDYMFHHRAIVAVIVFVAAAAISGTLHRNRLARQRQQWHNYQQPGGK